MDNVSDKCKNPASIKRFWPGSDPDLVCIEHAQDSKRIADAMGFPLLLEPIGYFSGAPIQTEFPTCYCSKGFSQTIEVTTNETGNARIDKGER